MRTLLEDFDQQLRENQSERDSLRLISCLEGLVILSHSARAKKQFDETHIRVDTHMLMTARASVHRTAANSLADLFVIRPHVRDCTRQLACLTKKAVTASLTRC